MNIRAQATTRTVQQEHSDMYAKDLYRRKTNELNDVLRENEDLKDTEKRLVDELQVFQSRFSL